MGIKIDKVTGKAVHVPGNDVDTDRIIPARFLKCVTFDGLGEHAFRDERYEESGAAKSHPLNDSRYSEASIMLVGRNFGCGSSREHAPQALARAGFRAVVGESFAEIFFGNCITLGMVCVTASAEAIARVAQSVAQDPNTEFVIDVQQMSMSAGSFKTEVNLPNSARDALANGQWDPLITLLEGATATRKTFEQLPYRAWERS